MFYIFSFSLAPSAPLATLPWFTIAAAMERRDLASGETREGKRGQEADASGQRSRINTPSAGSLAHAFTFGRIEDLNTR